MHTLELKKQLIDKIESTNDDILLEEIYRILDMGEDNLELYKLSSHQKAAIDEGLEDVKQGNVISHEDAKKEIDEWLSK